jgi:hypothetical protein
VTQVPTGSPRNRRKICCREHSQRRSACIWRVALRRTACRSAHCPNYPRDSSSIPWRTESSRLSPSLFLPISRPISCVVLLHIQGKRNTRLAGCRGIMRKRCDRENPAEPVPSGGARRERLSGTRWVPDTPRTRPVSQRTWDIAGAPMRRRNRPQRRRLRRCSGGCSRPCRRARHFTRGQPPSCSGRNAWSPGTVASSL